MDIFNKPYNKPYIKPYIKPYNKLILRSDPNFPPWTF